MLDISKIKKKMKINNVIHVVPNTKRFYVDVTTTSGVDVQPLVEVELEANGMFAIIDIEFFGDDDELSESDKYDVQDIIQAIDWEKVYHQPD